MFNFGDNVDRDKRSNSTLSPVCKDGRQSRNDITIRLSCNRRQSTFDKRATKQRQKRDIVEIDKVEVDFDNVEFDFVANVYRALGVPVGILS